MSTFQSDDEKPLDPAQAIIVAKVRRLMWISGLTTLAGVVAIIGVIGYRVFKDEGRVVDVAAMLPKGAKIVATVVSRDRIAVTIDVAGALEIRTFDLKSLKPTGRLRLTNEP